jgi:hypothetical protein
MRNRVGRGAVALAALSPAAVAGMAAHRSTLSPRRVF